MTARVSSGRNHNSGSHILHSTLCLRQFRGPRRAVFVTGAVERTIPAAQSPSRLAKGAGFSVKGECFGVKGSGFRVKSTGFSSYIDRSKSGWASAPEGIIPRASFIAAVLLIAALLSPTLFAQQHSSSGQSPNVHDLAQRVDRHYNQLHSLKATFTESFEGLGMSRSESGTLLLLKPGRMRWDYTAPAGKLFLLDGKYAWFYSRGDAQVQRIPAKQLDDLRSPLRFLLGHTQLEKELDNLAVVPAANGQFTITGQPHGQQNRVRNLKLTVTAEGTITAIQIEETDGALTRFTFGGEETNVPVPAELFHFTPPAGVPVVDSLPPV